MLILSSPAKRLDFESRIKIKEFSTPVYLDRATRLAKAFSKLDKSRLEQLMDISKDLAELNYQRFQDWDPEHTPQNSRPAIFAYEGDVWKQMEPKTYTDLQQNYAQDSLRILSGLYGILKPYDLIQPYRLEMSTKFGVGSAKNLYEYWTKHITEELNREIKSGGHEMILDLASFEYSKAVNYLKIKIPIVSVKFQQMSGGRQQTIMLPTKYARGQMINYLIKNKITDLDKVKQFDLDGYKLQSEEDTELIFVKQ